jgi:hypothetical protein
LHEENDLCDYGPQFTASRREAVSSRAIPSRENFSRYNEGCDVRTEILKKIRETIEKHEKFHSPVRPCEFLESEAYAGKSVSAKTFMFGDEPYP